MKGFELETTIYPGRRPLDRRLAQPTSTSILPTVMRSVAVSAAPAFRRRARPRTRRSWTYSASASSTIDEIGAGHVELPVRRFVPVAISSPTPTTRPWSADRRPLPRQRADRLHHRGRGLAGRARSQNIFDKYYFLSVSDIVALARRWSPACPACRAPGRSASRVLRPVGRATRRGICAPPDRSPTATYKQCLDGSVVAMDAACPPPPAPASAAGAGGPADRRTRLRRTAD